MSKHETPKEQMDLFNENPDPAVIAELLRRAEEERRNAPPAGSGEGSAKSSVAGLEKLAGTHCSRCDTERDAKGHCLCNRTWEGERVSS